MNWQQLLKSQDVLVYGSFVGYCLLHKVYSSFRFYHHLYFLDLEDSKRELKELINAEERKPQTTSKKLRIRILDLDGSMLLQENLLKQFSPEIINLKDWGPYVRIGCDLKQYAMFEREVSKRIGSRWDWIRGFWKKSTTKTISTPTPTTSTTLTTTTQNEEKETLVTFYGSNDFHHVALILFRRIPVPFNAVIFDNHPDWFTRNPIMHCGCWLAHVAQLETCRGVFHFGGCSGEFDDDLSSYPFHPFELLRSGKIRFFPGLEQFETRRWQTHQIPQPTLVGTQGGALSKERIKRLLEPYRSQFSEFPLYITIDKDVLHRIAAKQNWNSGMMFKSDLLMMLEVLMDLCRGDLIAVDITGEFAPVEVRGWFRQWLHNFQHSDTENNQNPTECNTINQSTNIDLLNFFSNVRQ